MVFRKRWAAALLALALALSVVGTAFAAETVPGAVYTSRGEVRLPSEVEASFVTNGVKDVDQDHWAAGSLSVLLDTGLIAPDTDGNLRPESPMPFDNGVAVFAKVLGLASKTDSPEAAAQKAVEAGLVEEKTGPLTRLDAAVLLFNALGLQAKPGVTASTAGFTDVAGVDSQYWGILAALKEAGVFKGFPDGSFNPGGELTVTQLAILVDRILGTFAN